MGFFDKLHKVRDKAQGAVGAVIPRPGGDIGGVPARGTVVELIQGPFGQRNRGSALWNKVTLSLRLADADPSSAPQVVECSLKTRAWLDLDEGLDVPVRVDAATGALLGLDCEAYEAERDARPPTPGYVPDNEPAAESLAPVEGVTFDQWVSTTAGIATHAVAPADYDAFASSRGVPAGRWTSVNAEWQARMAADWKLGAKFGAAYQAAMTNPESGLK